MRRVVVALTLALSSVLGGQTARTPGDSALRVVGTVRDEAGLPLQGVEVGIAALARSTRTDAVGHFGLETGTEGVFEVVARKVGYKPFTWIATVHSSSPQPVQIVLGSTPQLLSAMTIAGRRDKLPRVYERQSKRLGAVLFAEDIPRYRQHDVGGLLQFVPKFSSTLAATKGCRGAYEYVDGRPVPPNMSLSEYVHLDDIEAIEVFKSADFVREIFLTVPFSPNAPPPPRTIGEMSLGTAPPNSGQSIKGGCKRLILVWTHFYKGK